MKTRLNELIFEVFYWSSITLIIIGVMGIITVKADPNFLSDLPKEYQKPEGWIDYISSISKATIPLVIARIALENYKLSVSNSYEKNFQDAYNDWKPLIEKRLKEVEPNNPILVEIYSSKQKQYFRILHDYHYKVGTGKELARLFSLFRDDVSRIEEDNKHFIENGFYKSENHSYSFENFCEVFIFSIDFRYNSLKEDLKKLYLQELPSDRFIDKAMYDHKENSLDKLK